MKPEDSLYITIADWLIVKYPNLLWLHTPNGGGRVNKQNKQGAWYSPEAVKLQYMGVKAGVPHIFIPLPCYKRIPLSINFKPEVTEDLIEVLKFNQENHNAYIIMPADAPKPVYCGFFAELKIKPNKPTPTQKEIMQQLAELGYYCCVCYTLDEFIKEWEGYCG